MTDKTDEQLIAEGVTIAAATGYAGGTGPLGPLIEGAMVQAALDCNKAGIADDTRHDRLVEIVGEAKMVELFGDDHANRIGADYIREMKIAARHQVKEEQRALLQEHETKMAEAAAEG